MDGVPFTPTLRTAKIRRIAFPFHPRTIVKRSVVTPKRFSNTNMSFDDCNEPTLVAPTATSTDVFALPDATALRTNMGSIIVPNTASADTMRESNIFFNFERRGSASTAASPTTSVYLTADEESPLGRLCAVPAPRDNTESPLGRKTAGATNAQANKGSVSASSSESTMVVEETGNTPDTVSVPRNKVVPVLELNTQFLDSADSLVDLAHSTSAERDVEWASGEGPCRVCHGAVVAKPGDRSRRAVFAAELHGQWHRGCFTCSDCAQPLNREQPCYVHEDIPYCQQHYHEHNGSLCAICHTGVEGDCLENHKQERFHTECLRCYICQETIQQEYSLINDTIAICQHHDLEALAQEGIVQF